MSLNEYEKIVDEIDDVEPVNDYKSIANRLRVQKRNNLQNSFRQSEGKDPEFSSEVLKLSKKLNMPARIVEQEYDTLKKQSDNDSFDYESIVDGYSNTSKYLQDPRRAAIAKDDVESLKKIEKNHRLVLADKNNNGLLYEYGRASQQGFSDLGSANVMLMVAYGLIDSNQAAVAVSNLNKRSSELRSRAPDYAKEFNKLWEEEGKDVSLAWNRFTKTKKQIENGRIKDGLADFFQGSIMLGEAMDLVFGSIGNPAGLGYSVFENMAYNLPSLITGAAGSKIGAVGGGAVGTAIAPGAGTIVGTTFGGVGGFVTGSFAGSVFTEIGASILEDFSKKGIDTSNPAALAKAFNDPNLMKEIRERAERKGVTTASVDALFNALGGKFLRASKGGGIGKIVAGGAADIGVQMLGEGGSEFAGQAAREKSIAAADPVEALREGITSLGHSVGDVAIGYGARAGTSIRNKFSKNPTKAAKEASVETAKAIQDQRDIVAIKEMGETIKSGSKLAQRDIDEVRDFIESATGIDEDGDVYFQSDDWNTFWSDRGESPALKAQEIIGDNGSAVYHEAVSTKGAIKIPLSEYLTKVAPSEFFEDSLLILRTRSDGMTINEASEFLSDIPSAFETIAAESQGQIAEVDALESSASRIQNRVYQQLKLAGESDAVAEQQAQVTAAGLKALAQRSGIDPEVLYNRYNMKIRRDGVQSLITEAPKVDRVDAILDRLRTGDIPSEKDVGGQSLVDFLIEKGGIRPEQEGRDLRAMDAQRQRIGLLNRKGMFIDRAAELAAESGFLQERDIRTLLESIDSELRGNPVFSAKNINEQLDSVVNELREYEQLLGQLGIDINELNNEEIKQRINEAFPEKTTEERLDQPAEELPEFVTSEEFDVEEDDGEFYFQSDNNFANISFYSTLERTLDQKIQGQSATIEQIRGLMKNLKPEEIKWSGIDEFLEGKTKVDKNDLMQFLAANRLQVEEVALHGEDKIKKGFEVRQDENGKWNLYDKNNEDVYVKPFDSEEELIQTAMRDSELVDRSDETKFSSYTLPGGRNYREVLFTLPYDTSKFEYKITKVNETSDSDVNYQVVRMADLHPVTRPLNYMEAAETLASYERNESRDKSKFIGTHFDQPNVLAHVRLKDRTEGGKKVLFVEEIQSDWHQKGRDVGYKSDIDTSEFKIVVRSEPDLTGRVEMVVLDNEGLEVFVGMAKESDKEKMLSEIKSQYESKVGVPDAPFRKTWHEFSLKKILQMAVEGGYDQVAWTTGEQQAERYDLSKEISEIHYSQTNLKAYDKNGNEVISQTGVTKEDLPDYIGKEAAKKLLEQEPDGTLRSLVGEDLKVGGEGMKGFYDNMIPKAADKLVKKFDKSVKTKRGKIDGHDAHVLDITKKLKDEITDKGFSLFQKIDKNVKGAIQFKPNREVEITLTDKADLTTYLHETGHFFLEVMADLAQESDVISEDFNKILSWMGVESRDQIKTEQHEQFARGFEAYLMEGKAPSVGLRRAFSKIRTWFIAVYNHLRSLNVELSDEVRGVFDRMLATDEEIAEANENLGIQPLYDETNYADFGLTGRKRERLIEARNDADRTAKEILDAEILRNYRAKRKRFLNKERARMTKEERDNLMNDKNYVALSIIQKGKMPDGSSRDGIAKPLKLNRQAIVDEFGKDFLKRLPRPYVYTSDSGIMPDDAAMILGFSNGSDLVETLANLMPADKYVKARVDARMISEHGDLISQGTLPEKAMEAVSNEHQSEAMMLELEHMVSNDFPAYRDIVEKMATRLPTVKEIRKDAEDFILRQAIRDIRPQTYLTAVRRHAREAYQLLNKGNFEAAFESKVLELVNYERYIAAINAKNESVKISRQLNKYNELKTRKRIGKAGGDYLAQIDKIMDRFNFRPGVSLKKIDQLKSLKDWYQNQIEETGSIPDVPFRLLDEAYRKHYKEMTFEELRGIRDIIKNIDHLAKLKNKLLTDQINKTFEQAKEEIVTEIKKNSKGKKEVDPETRLTRNEIKRAANGFFAHHRKMSSFFRVMDGFKEGALFDNILTKINDAGNKEATMNAEAGQKLYDLYEGLLLSDEERKSNIVNRNKLKIARTRNLYKKQKIPELSGTELSRMTKMGQIVFTLNWGNLDSRQKLIDGYGITEAQGQAVVNRLTKRDMDFVQNVWNYIDTFWAESKAISQRVDGVAPSKVEAAAVETPHGTYIGGYFPIKYDDRQSHRAYEFLAKEAADRSMRGAAIRGSTKHGHRKERVSGVKRPIRLDFGAIFEHVSEVIHDQTHYEMLIDVNRLIGSQDVQNAIYSHYGDQVYKEIILTINDVAAGHIPAQSHVEQAFNHLRIGSTIAGLGYNLTTSMLQPLGLTQSMVRVGPKWIGRGIKKWLGNAVTMQSTVEEIYKKSDFMKMRGSTMIREINEIRNRLTLKGVVLHDVDQSYFYLIQKLQMIADVPTWLGAYEKAMATMRETGKKFTPEQMEKRAVSIADQAVLDSQGGGQMKDLAGVQRGGVYKKLWTNFYSFFNTTYNLTAESYAKTDFKNVKSVGAFAVDMLLLYTVPAVLSTLVREGMKGFGDDDEPFVEKIIREQLSYMLGTMVGVRELGSAVQGFYGYSGPAGARFFSDFGSLLSQASQGEADEAFWRALGKTGGVLFHLPAGQVDRTVRGFIQLYEGGTSNPMVLLGGPER